MGKITDIVFDKTGTLTFQNSSSVNYTGNQLSLKEEQQILSLVKHSSHPLSRLLYEHLKTKARLAEKVTDYEEIPGKGISGKVMGDEIYLGSKEWVGGLANDEKLATRIYIKISQNVVGYYQVENKYRPGFEKVINVLQQKYRLHVLSGDNESEKENLLKYFPDENVLHFNQKPIDKLNYIKNIKDEQRVIMMIGDGLNDAGALKQSDVGIVISEDVYNFTPACDGILDAGMFQKIPEFIRLGKYSLSVLKISYIVSLLYNITGLSFAFFNQLSPLVAAILMPLSSISVVIITTLLIRIYSNKHF